MRRETYRPDATCPLDGVRILDLSRVVAGNVLTHVLADLGADVIKVEPPEGDALRAWKENGIPVQWKVYARNKRSIVLDLKAAADRQTFMELVGTAQVLIENFRPGVLDRLGFPAETLHALQPSLVIARITGWGQSGPYRNRPGFGTLVEAASGLAHKTGFPGSPPLLPNLGLADSVAGLYGAVAVMTALRRAEVHGEPGQEIDISLLEPMISILGADAAVYRATGKAPTRTGNRTTLSAPRNIYLTSDEQYLALSASTQSMTERLFAAIGRADLITDDRFRTNADRVRNVELLDGIIGEFIAARTLAQNLAYFETAEVTVGPVYDVVQLMHDRHVIERGSTVEFDDADLGSLPMHPVVPRLSRTPGAIRRPAPKLNEHAAEIAAELRARPARAARQTPKSS
jgi:crotonobetainyl-CoA:carnitine CoA-transferase CaiB-like acyl-CoA transferase